MVDGHHLDAALFKPLPVLARDLEVGLDDAHGRDAPEADDDLRPQQRDLTAKIADAGVLLHAERVAKAAAAGKMRAARVAMRGESW